MQRKMLNPLIDNVYTVYISCIINNFRENGFLLYVFDVCRITINLLLETF